MKFIINKESNFEQGLIVIEQPHRGKPKVWFASDEKDFINLVKAEADLYRTFCDVKTFQEAVDFTRDDLQSLIILKKDAIDSEWLGNNSEVARLAVAYGWASEIK